MCGVFCVAGPERKLAFSQALSHKKHSGSLWLPERSSPPRFAVTPFQDVEALQGRQILPFEEGCPVMFVRNKFQ